MAIVKKTYKDQVIDHIYQLILADHLKPGDRLKESLLALEMGISRAPIREALKELMTLGLIDYKPQIGNFLPVMTAKQIIDSYTTRGVLEGYAVMSASEYFTRQDLKSRSLILAASSMILWLPVAITSSYWNIPVA